MSRLIFAISSGRAGSEYLARLLGTARNTTAFHEPQPTMTGQVLDLVTRLPLASTTTARRHKATVVREWVQAHEGQTYVETSHMFIKTFHDVMLEEFAEDDLRVVVLRRSLAATLRSFVQMGYFSSRNRAWPAWMHSAWTPMAIEPPPLPFEEADHVDRCLAYLVDIEQRAQEFMTRHAGIPTVEVRLEDLQHEGHVSAMFDELGLEPTESGRDAIGRAVNERTHRKRQIGIEMDLRTAHHRIEAYLDRYDTAGRQRPHLPQHERLAGTSTPDRPSAPQDGAVDSADPTPPVAIKPFTANQSPWQATTRPERRGLHIAHIVNPVQVGPSSDLFVAQPVTFEAMRRAKRFAESCGHKVSLLATGTPEDREAAPDDFAWAGDLTRTGLDLGSFDVERPLPLLHDLLDGLTTVPEADLYVFTNVDIAPLPHFYDTVARLHESGHDAMVINRRTISDTYSSPEDLSMMYAEVGQRHPGHDCFVFTPALLHKCDVADVVVGINWVGRALIWNLAMYASSFVELKDAHLTFHIGDSRSWQSPRLADWRAFNQREAEKVLRQVLAGHERVDRSMAIVPYLEDLGILVT